jgi:hypothetical protein
MDAIYWVKFRYQLNIYRQLQYNEISVVEDNAFNNLPSLTYL